ncbi:hypothetical protein HAX54_053092 [Datura stramonium]|uniref:Uncharacterized protein n=1 Tax=Datura stramonium TaxID=4076 RepID=A0ABS8WRJ1_DATST|nr:hypothetical protein [Datura stramonium]
MKKVHTLKPSIVTGRGVRHSTYPKLVEGEKIEEIGIEVLDDRETSEVNQDIAQLIPRRVRSYLTEESKNPIIIPKDEPASPLPLHPTPAHTLFTRSKRKEAEIALLTLVKAKRGKSSTTPTNTLPHSIDTIDKGDTDLEL